MRRALEAALASAALLAGCAGDHRPAQPPDAAALSSPRIAPTLANTELGIVLSERILSGPTLAAARAGERVAEANLDDRRAAAGPSLSLGATTRVATGPDPGFQPTLTLSQLLYDNGATDLMIRASAARTVSAGATTEARVTLRALEAIRAWDEAYSTVRLLDIARASLARSEEIEDRVDLRRTSGAGRSAETLRVAARRADAAAGVARAEGTLFAAEARLRELLGPVAATGPVPTAPQGAASPGMTPAILGLRADIRAAEAELEARRSERVPGIFLDVTGSLDTEDEPVFGAGLRVDYAFDVSGRRDAAEDAAEAEVERLRAELTLAESDLARALADARNREAALLAEATAARAAETAARQALADAERSFATGRVDILDLLDLGRDLDDAASRSVAVQAAHRLAGYERLAVAGDLLAAFGLDLGEDTE